MEFAENTSKRNKYIVLGSISAIIFFVLYFLETFVYSIFSFLLYFEILAFIVNKIFNCTYFHKFRL